MAHDPKPLDELIKAPPAAHRRGDAIAKAQVILPIFAVLAAIGFGVVEWLVRGEARYSPAPLASVHAQWDNQCAACHVSSQPLAAQNWLAALTDQDHVADAKCQTCHAGPSHHKTQKESEVHGCTACHHDHLGRPGHLLAVGDAHCTYCHRNLAEHFVAEKVGEKVAFDNVSGFSLASHPEFALIREKRKDPGTISFNHARHLIPGMGTDPDKPGPFTLAQLAPKDRDVYRKPDQKVDSDPVILDCRSCHQTEAGDFQKTPNQLDGLPVASLRPVRGAGATMAPIIFEQHCQACHPLSIDRKIPGDSKTELLTIRHRQQPQEIFESLRGHYTNLLLKDLWKPQPAMAAAVLPGKPAEKQRLVTEIDARAQAAVLAGLFEDHEKLLTLKVLGQTTCQKCHASLDPAKGLAQVVPPANIPAIWFTHARFDHTSHRAVDCRECHAAAYPRQREAPRTGSTTNQDVMLPGIQTCVQCHAPARGAGPTATGGVRHDCITCHTYHHGDNPLLDRGSRARQPLGAARTIADFLSGK
jgi:hypothetical protein